MTKPFFAVASDIFRESGFQGLYTGYWFNSLLCLNPAIVNTVFDVLKTKMVLAKVTAAALEKTVAEKTTNFTSQANQKKFFLSPLEAFALGAFAKSVATVLTYPLVRVKTKLQAGTSDLDAENTKGENGIRYYFRGIGPSLLKTCLQAAIMYAAKEHIAKFTRLLFVSTLHFLRPLGRRHKLKALGGKPLV